MKTYVEIEKINSYGEKGKALVRTVDIVGIKEKHVEPTKLFDGNGNVVSETPSPKDFQVLVVNQYGSKITYHIDQAEYDRLSQILLAE